MNVTLPKRPNSREEVIIDSKSIVVIGANGSGKTRFGRALEENYNSKTHRISAQKSLSMPEQVSPTSVETAKKDFLYGYGNGESGHKISHRWGSKPNTFLLDDYHKLMVLLHTEEYEESIEFKDAYRSGQTNEKPVTKLDKIQMIWEEVLPHRKLSKKAGRIETYPTENPSKNYNAAEMSDGERVVFYLIGEIVSVPADSLLIIDEPELHLHKSITKKLWDEIEQERPDCTFIYLTHDIDFAFSRQNATKIWAKGFDGNFWDYEILAGNSEIPEQLYLEILGSRKPILFIEGDDSSIDYRLFQLVFSEYTIKPLGSCSKVFEVTKSFGEQKSFHNIDSFGLIDRDRRTDEEISHIQNPNIWIAEVAEVENFLLLEGVIKIVASKMMKDPEKVFDGAKKNVIEFFKTQIDRQAIEHTISRIGSIFKNATTFNGIKKIEDVEENLNNFWSSQDFRKIYNEIKSTFENLVVTQNYNEITKVFNHKDLLSASRLTELCDLNSKTKDVYLNFVLSTLKEESENSTKIRKAITDKIKK